MKQHRPQRSGFPRVNCIVDGCARGTTRIRPDADGAQGDWICADHWRTVPKAWRRRLSLFGRRARAAEKRGDDEKMQRAARAYWSLWARIVALFDPDTAPSDEAGLPLTMREELRRIGLL